MCAETRMQRWTGTELIHESRCRETLRKPQFGSNPTGPEGKGKAWEPLGGSGREHKGQWLVLVGDRDDDFVLFCVFFRA